MTLFCNLFMERPSYIVFPDPNTAVLPLDGTCCRLLLLMSVICNYVTDLRYVKLCSWW